MTSTETELDLVYGVNMIFLNRLFQVHTGEKPFKCDICEVSFADRFALKRHRSVHEKYGRTSSQTNSQGKHCLINLIIIIN